MSIAVFDVGGTFIKYGLVNDGKMIQTGKVPTPSDTQEHFLEAIENVLSTLENVQGVAFSLPGVFDVDKKYIFAGGSLFYNNHTDVTNWEKRFHLPIEIFNDARSCALAELSAGNMQGINNGIVLTFGTGVGCALIIDGNIHIGSHLIAGEVSVILSGKEKRLLGSIGGVPHLIKRIAQAKGVDTTDGKEAFQWIEQNDEKCTAVFEEYCDDIVQIMHNFQCILDPEKICIGGGISENPLFIDGLKKARERFYKKFPIKFPQAELEVCKYHNDSNLWGAYYHYIKKQRV